MKVVVVGCGGIGCAVLEMIPLLRGGILPRDFAKELTIIEPKAVAGLPVLKPFKYRHVRKELTSSNLNIVMNSVLTKGGVVLDCSVNVDALAMMSVCYRFDCLYVNCSQEDWFTADAGHIDKSQKGLMRRSLCARIWRARELYGGRGPSMLADQGMNPGIVSLFALRGLEDMAWAVGAVAAAEAVRAGQYAKAAEMLGVRVIHITERDTQTLRRPKPRGKFYNTWSSIGLAAEALDPVQMGRGTHEAAPAVPGTVDVRNMRIVPARGMDRRAWSYSPARRGPGRTYEGFVIPHGEANTLSHCLSAPGGAYRPSVYFVYQPCPAARASLAEMRRRDYAPPTSKTAVVVTLPMLKSGYDAVGALIWSDRYPAWWSGTVLDYADMRPIGVAYSGPTTVQVAIAMLSALKWMLANPSRGFLTPEDLPYRQILDDCAPYLGRVLSTQVPADRCPQPASLQYKAFEVASRVRATGTTSKKKPPSDGQRPTKHRKKRKPAAK
jgi:homospermidine synthase